MNHLGNLAVRTRQPEIATSPPFADSGRLLAMTGRPVKAIRLHDTGMIQQELYAR